MKRLLVLPLTGSGAPAVAAPFDIELTLNSETFTETKYPLTKNKTKYSDAKNTFATKENFKNWRKNFWATPRGFFLHRTH